MYQNTDMSRLSSMKTGGIAEKCFFPENTAELCETLKELVCNNEKYYVLGNMSNVLIPDGVLEFVPVITTKMNKFKVTDNGNDTVCVSADCGVMLTRLAYEMCKLGYSGMEFAYGIPGTVGGAVFMNAGAYGSEVANIIESVQAFDLETNNILNLNSDDCDFSYRKSIFQSGKYVILSALFVLSKADAKEITEIAKQTMQKRIDKQPLEYPSCGSAFKRPEGFFAGELIEKSNLKGYSVGGACISEKHAGFIINKGNATTEDVVELIKHVQKTVKDKFGVELEPEIRVIK